MATIPDAAAAVVPTDDTSISDWSDELLLLAVGMRDGHQSDAAFQVFHLRWKDKLLAHIKLNAHFHPAAHFGHVALEQEAWVRVVEKAHTFDGADLAGSALSARTFGWLKRVARSAVVDLIRQERKVPLCAIPDKDIVAPKQVPKDLIGSGPEMAAIFECMRHLSPKKQEVLWRFASFMGKDGKVSDMPPEVRKYILDDTKTTMDGLNHIRIRAFAALRKCALAKMKMANSK